MTFAAAGWPVLLGLFAFAGLLITYCGIRLATLADRLADRTGLGEALIGGVLLGAGTSVSGMVVTVTAALDGRASLAFSNGIGGIAVQTAYLAFADLLYRRANLEHAAAELANVFQSAVLLFLLSLPFLAQAGPDVTIWAVHPISLVLVVVYIAGVHWARQVRTTPMWHPVQTTETKPDRPDPTPADEGSVAGLVGRFMMLVLIMAGSGWIIANVAGTLITRYDLNASLMGALATAVVTSMPELVTTLAAVRRGALQLAVGGIIGGNTFDALFVTLADVSYRQGSIYHALERSDFFWLAIGVVMTSILILGQLYRQRKGPAEMGLESLALILVWLGAVGVQGVFN